jgi:thioesterase domain-containing protein/non-ribosomal peptide synthetase component F
LNTDFISETIGLTQDHFRMPASVAQQRIWSSCAQHGAAWNVAVRFLLRGTLSLTAFQQAVQALTANNEILRTSFSFEGSTLDQVIHPSVDVPVAVFNLTNLSGEERDRELDRISKQEARRKFHPEVAPLFHVGVVQTGESEHVLLLTLHHLICDGWSIGILSQELMTAYGHNILDSPAEETERLQYADYAVWHDELRRSAEYRNHEQFWRQYLLSDQGDHSGPPHLPKLADGDQPESLIVSSLLPVSLTNTVRMLARQKGTTFFHVVLSAFGMLQASENASGISTVGIPVSGRPSAELETVVGPFVNYLPFRTKMSSGQTVGEFIQATAAEFTDLMSHSDYRFEDMVGFSGDNRQLFDSAFICQKDFVKPMNVGGLELTALPSVSPGALLGKTVFLVEREEGWRASCEVDTGRYSESDAKRYLSSFEQILSLVAEDSEQTIAKIMGNTAAAAKSETAEVKAPEGMSNSPVSESEPFATSSLEFPASEAQTRYWLLDQSQAGKSAFHLRIRLMVEGDLDVTCLVRSIEHLVRRHESLRTTFVMREDGLRQRVHDPAMPFSFQSVANLAAAGTEPDQRVAQLLAVEDTWEFDFEAGPLLRVLLIEVEKGRWILSISMAHLIGDGWSCGVFQRELQEAYRAFRANESPNLQEISVQYGDYAVHEESWLRSAEAEKRVAFWRGQLDGKLAILDLPVDIEVTQTSKSKGGIETAEIDSSVAAAVRILARKLDTTPFIVYGALFQALLLRYSGQTDIVFSTPLASRTEETEAAIGPFSMPILLRSKTQVDWSGRQFIEGLRNVAMDTFDNALPFEKYADLVALHANKGRHALNQICFFYQKAFVDVAHVAGLQLSPLPTTVTGAGFQWQLAVIERSDRVVAELQYDADVFSRQSIRLALAHYQKLAAECVEAPNAPVKSLQIVSAEEVQAAEQGVPMLPISRRALGIEMPGPVAENQASEAEHVLAETDEEIRMARLWERVFRRKDISIHANFFDLGGHSLMLARLQALAQKEYGVRIGAADIFVAPTISLLASRLNGRDLNGTLHPRLIPIRSEGSQTPLYLISQSMVFRRMAERLGVDQPVFTIQMEDNDLRQIGTDASFEQIASFYVNIIREVRPHGPYRIGGWCLSGWIAYEVAQQLRGLGETVEMLLVVDAWAPGYWRDMAGRKRLLAKSSYYWSRLRLHVRSLSHMTPGQRLKFLAERFRLWRAALARQVSSGLSAAGVAMDVKMEEQTTFADQVVFAASRKYKAREWEGNVLFFRSSEQPTGKYLAHDMGWSELVKSGAEITTLPGDHRQIFDDPGAKILAGEITALLSPGSRKGWDPENLRQTAKQVTGYSDGRSCVVATR